LIPSNCVTGVVIEIEGSIGILFSHRMITCRLSRIYFPFH
jgi:hypothetical protein